MAHSQVRTSLESTIELHGSRGGRDDSLRDEDSENSERGGELHIDKVGGDRNGDLEK